jgi:hypothetical protein
MYHFGKTAEGRLGISREQLKVFHAETAEAQRKIKNNEQRAKNLCSLTGSWQKQVAATSCVYRAGLLLLTSEVSVAAELARA